KAARQRTKERVGGWIPTSSHGLTPSDFGLLTARRALLKHLVGRLAIDRFLVLAVERAGLNLGPALGRRQGSDPCARRANTCALRDRWFALPVQQGHESLTHGHFLDYALQIEFRIGAEGLGRSADRPLLDRSESAERVLDAVPELSRHIVGNI